MKSERKTHPTFLGVGTGVRTGVDLLESRFS